MSLTIDPPTLQIAASGGESTHNLVNGTETRLAFKVKSTNNNHYRLKPVYGFIEPGASSPIAVTRLAGPPKDDKLVIQFVVASPEVTDAKSFFSTVDASAVNEVEMPINATE